jgi:protein-L-isoaspartate(D-aspartate) O-methyltransferase
MVPPHSDINQMLDRQIINRGIDDPRVIEALKHVPRHLFVDEDLQDMAYSDTPLPIGCGQTISQPYIVAYMTWLAQVEPEETVLEIGLGSGYQAAVLAQLAKHVYSIEIIEALYKKATQRLHQAGYQNVTTLHGDGSHGWPAAAPYDVILATAAPRQEIPAALTSQLKPHGRLILPVGHALQYIYRITRHDNHLRQERLLPVRFVPMTGDAA